jgi:argininosuccinate synthase
MNDITPPRVILAFTGGLQSSVCLHWLAERLRADVTAAILELGQQCPTWELGENAVKLGASSAHVEDCREEFVRDYAFRALRASAVYEKSYMLSGALARPLIAAVITRLAREEGCWHVALGASAESNDLARFRTNVSALDSELKIIGPDEVAPLASRNDALEYAKEHDLVPKEGIAPCLSFDANLWGSAVTCEADLGTWENIPEEYFQLTTAPENAPDEPETVSIRFEQGTPVALDGEEMLPHQLVSQLNERAGRHGVGRVEVVEDRLTGVKAREVYEAPAATVLMEAHSALEELTLDYELLRSRSEMAPTYADLVYSGGWFSQLRKAMDAFVDVTQEPVTGEVKIRMFRGRASVSGRRSPNSLFDGTLVRKDGRLISRPTGEEPTTKRAQAFRVAWLNESENRTGEPRR